MRKTSKLLVMVVTLVALFAVFAFSANAVNNLAEQFQGEGLWFLYRPSTQ